VQVIARLMGLPREDYVRFQQLSIELLSVVAFRSPVALPVEFTTA
jgi:hypothetical protein